MFGRSAVRAMFTTSDAAAVLLILQLTLTGHHASSYSQPPSPVSNATPVRGGSSWSAKGPNNHSPPPDDVRSKKAIIVGGGPVGLAAALTLASPPHLYDVTVFESTTGVASTTNYDPTKAYLYHVNGRGQVLTQTFPSMQRTLEERGVPSGGTAGQTGFLIVPGDPNAPLPEVKTVSVAVAPKGMTNAPNKGMKTNFSPKKKESYWIPRHMMVQLMHEVMEEHENDRRKGKSLGRIDYVAGGECVSVQPAGTSDGVVEVTIRDVTTGKETCHAAELVVGADGMNSKVRESLATGTEAFAVWPKVNHKKFRVRKWISPASGLRLKAIQFPPQFQIPGNNGTSITTTSQTTYAIRSVNTRPLNYVSLGFLPMKDNNQIRPSNVIGRPNHEIWKLNDGESVRQWFERAFPRLPFHKGGTLVPDKEWDRFAKAEGTRFPPCQYSRGMHVASPTGECGVALVGDAVHAYPPDIGQGVNSGLGDVVALDRALRGVDILSGEEKKGAAGPVPDLGTALRNYEKVRSPEVKALIRLARFGSPYQYRQPLRRDRVGRWLWTANVLLRLLLNKMTFGLIPTSSIMLSQNNELTFRQVMRRADMTTMGLTVATAAALVWILKGWGII